MSTFRYKVGQVLVTDRDNYSQVIISKVDDAGIVINYTYLGAEFHEPVSFSLTDLFIRQGVWIVRGSSSDIWAKLND